MTQVVTDMVSGVVPVAAPAPVTDVVTADGGLLDRQIPRPRGVTTLPLVAPAALVPTALPEPVISTVVPELPQRRASRAVPMWPALVLDLVLALGLAVVSVSQGRLELPAAIATALAWPPLLAVSGRYRRQGPAVRRRRTPSAPARRAGRPAARRPRGRGAPPGERHPRGGRGLPHPCIEDPGGGRRAGLRGSPGLFDGGPRPRRRRPGGAARREAVARRGAPAPLVPVRPGHRALPRHGPAGRRAPADPGDVDRRS